MRFRGYLHHLLDCILSGEPGLGPTLIRKVNLADAYMLIWGRLEDITSVAFLTPKETDSKQQLVVFHLLIPMGYVGSAPFFCATTETIKDRKNSTMHVYGEFPVLPLDNLSETHLQERDSRRK